MGKPNMSVRMGIHPAHHPSIRTSGPSRVKQGSSSATGTGAPVAIQRLLASCTTTRAAASTSANAQQPSTIAAPSLDWPSSSSGHTSAAARYASARHVVVRHKQAQRLKRSGQAEELAVDSERLPQRSKQPQQPDTTDNSPRQIEQQEQQQQQEQRRRQFTTAAKTRLLSQDHTQDERQPTVQQGLQQLLQQRQLRQQQDNPFGNAVALYRMYACSNSMVEWQEAAYGLQRLARRVSSPLQAQQVWQAAAALQAQPLHKQCARVLGGAVVELAQVTLRNHDPSILQALIASHHTLQFSFNKRHIDKLLLAAVAADVGLEELQALLNLVPAAMLSNRSYFVLIKSFIARQQVAEAAHCFHQMEVAGLHLTPALQQLKEMLTK